LPEKRFNNTTHTEKTKAIADLMQNKSIEDTKIIVSEKKTNIKFRRSSMILQSILEKLKNTMNSPTNGLPGASSARDVLKLNKGRTNHKRKVNISLTYLQHLLKTKTLGKEMVQAYRHVSKNKSITGSCKDKFTSKVSHSESIDGIFPLRAIEALKVFGSKLTIYEKSEILDYEELYFMGNGIARRSAGSENRYDDEIGDYNTYVGEHIAYRYEIIDILGKGTFGQAIKCLDHKTRQIVALKIIKSKKKFYYQAMVEVKILKYLKEHNKDDKGNIVKTLDFFIFRKHIVIFLIDFIVHCI